MNGEQQAKLKALDEIQLKFDVSAGLSVTIEHRMRYIAQLSQQVRNELQKTITRIGHSKDYWECNLEYLDAAILKIYFTNSPEYTIIERFRTLRNKLLHADFVGLLRLLNISPKGRMYSSSIRDRLPLKDSSDLYEAALSVENNRGLDEFNKLAWQVKQIFDDLIIQISVNS